MRASILAVFLIAVAAVSAQSSTFIGHGRDQLRFVLVLSRHGIRSSLVDASALNVYASDPWPAWEVPRGFLTPHGALAIRQMGAFDEAFAPIEEHPRYGRIGSYVRVSHPLILGNFVVCLARTDRTTEKRSSLTAIDWSHTK
jgi:hypothetical protein